MEIETIFWQVPLPKPRLFYSFSDLCSVPLVLHCRWGALECARGIKHARVSPAVTGSLAAG